MKKYLFEYKFSRFELLMFSVFLILLITDNLWTAMGVWVLSCIIQLIFGDKTNETK